MSFDFVYSRDIFHVEGFPYKDQIGELFTVMVYCIYSQHVTLSTLINFHFFNFNILTKATT